MRSRTLALAFIAAAMFGGAAADVRAAYNASDLLGQLDQNDLPYYTAGAANDAPNARGLNQPRPVALDAADHRLFVGDALNGRVLVFNLDSSNNLVDRVADNVLGQPDFKSSAAASTQSGMTTPYGIAYDAAGKRLFVSDALNSRVLVYDLSGGVANGMNASFVLGQANFTANLATTTQSGMNVPKGGLAYDAESMRLFVGDATNNRVLVFDVATSTIANGMNASFVLGQANFTAKTGTTTQSGMNAGGIAEDIAYDAGNRRLFVSEFNNNRVLVFDVATSTIANGMNASFVLGQATFASSTAATAQNRMNGPAAVSYDAGNRRLFVGDSSRRVLVFDVATSTIANGMNASFVLGQANFTASVATTTQNGMNGAVTGIAYDAGNQRALVSDSGGNRVLAFPAATSTIANGENAADALGQLNGDDTPNYAKNAANGAPFNRGFNLVNYVEVDTARHRLFANDFNNNRILVFNLDSSNNLVDRVADNVLGQADFRGGAVGISTSTFFNNQGMAYDAANDRLFVADINNNRVLVFNLSGGVANGMNASFVLGQANFTAQTPATTQSGMATPYDVEYDSKNNRLFVVDFTNNRVLVFNLSGGVANGMNASFVLGQANFTTSAASTTQSRFNAPEQIAYDSANERLFVSEFSNKRVMAFDVNPATIANGENALFVLGQPNFTSNSAFATQNGMAGATGVAYDSAGARLFVSDFIDHRVLVFDVNPATATSSMNASAVLGQTGFTSSASATTQSGLKNPWGLSYDDGNHRLYVADANNNRVTAFTLLRVSTASLPSGLTDQPYSQTLAAQDAPGALSWSVASGALPPGLSLSSSGVLSGTPTPGTAGNYTFTAQATDAADGSFLSDQKVYTVSVNLPGGGGVSFSPSPSPGGGGGGAFSSPPSSGTTAPVVSPSAAPAPASIPPTLDVVAIRAQIALLLEKVAELERQAGLPVAAPSVPATPLAPLAPSSSALPAPAPGKVLYVGMQGELIRKLQQWLNQNGFPLASSGPGSPGQETDRYGALTWSAVARFQEAYREDILVPSDLPQGNGVVGPRTWGKLKELGFQP